jgi:hypothetical protein
MPKNAPDAFGSCQGSPLALECRQEEQPLCARRDVGDFHLKIAPSRSIGRLRAKRFPIPRQNAATRIRDAVGKLTTLDQRNFIERSSVRRTVLSRNENAEMLGGAGHINADLLAVEAGGTGNPSSEVIPSHHDWHFPC